MENFEDRFKILHIEFTNEVDFDFSPFINRKYEKTKDHFKTAEDEKINFFCFFQLNTMPSSKIWQNIQHWIEKMTC